MKILFCTAEYKQGKGGVASYAHEFVSLFGETNDIMIVVDDSYTCSPDEMQTVVHVPAEYFTLGNAQLLLKIIHDYRPDVIVNSYFPLLSLVTPYLPDDIFVLSVSHFTDGRFAWPAGCNGNFADVIVALSTYNKKFIEKRFCISNSTKIKVVYNTMPSLPNTIIEEKKQRTKLKIVYPGGHCYKKSAEIVCMALKKLLNTDWEFEFYWLGDILLPGARWPLSRTKYVSDCLNSQDPRIKVFGQVSREEAISILADANIFLLPSRGEGCPMTLLEAMRGGCIPIISNAKHGSLDIIEDGKTGFVVEQGNANQICEQIGKIISNHSAYAFIYDNCFSKFENELSIRHWFGKMVEILSYPKNHNTRLLFDEKKFLSDSRQYKMMLRKEWLDDRFRVQPYHVLIFRWIRYIMKN